MTENIQAPLLTTEKRAQVQELLAELLLLSAAAAVRRGPLPLAERERRLNLILARREAVTEALFV